MVAFAPHVKRPASYEIQSGKQPRFLLSSLLNSKTTPLPPPLPLSLRFKLK